MTIAVRIQALTDLILPVLGFVFAYFGWIALTTSSFVANYGKTRKSGIVNTSVDIALFVVWGTGLVVANKFIDGGFFNGYSPTFSRVLAVFAVYGVIWGTKNKLLATINSFLGVLVYWWMLYLGSKYSVPYQQVLIMALIAALFYLMGYDYGKKEVQMEGFAKTSTNCCVKNSAENIGDRKNN